MPKIRVKLDLSWYHLSLLKEIEEKHYNTHKIITLIKSIAERNIDIICKLFEFFKDNELQTEDNNIKTFLEKNW